MKSPTSQNRIPRRKRRSQQRVERAALQRNYSTTKRTIQENPLVATMAMFGVGLAIGSVVGGLLADTVHTRRPALSDRIQRRVSAALSDMLPDSLERRLHG